MKSIFIIFLILISFYSFSQVKTKIFQEKIPSRFVPTDTQNITVKKLVANTEFKRLLRQPKSDAPKSEYKYKFAVPVNTNINLLTDGKINETKGYITYKLTLDAEEALNISARFNEFYLSPGAIFSIFSHSELTDSITAKENNESNEWETRVYQGSKLTFVLKIPSSEKGKIKLKIDQIRFGYKRFGSDYFGNPEASAPCNINVLCPEGVGWENERNSVAIIVSGGVETGTGALVMNTCNRNTPYVLTANHVLDGNVRNWVFQFQTWSTQCPIPTISWREDVQFNRCQLRANDAATDFALVQLNQTPSPNSNITYSGWSRNAAAATTATGIHHPMGDVMKISHDLDPVVSVAYMGGAVNHWQADFDQGIVQHGSSGSPLYDQNHRIVGQLHGNQNNQCPIGDNVCFCLQLPSIGEYGRFDLSWTGGGTASTRLSDWLDPSNSNAMTTNTTNVLTLIAAIIGNDIMCSSTGTYSVTIPAGATVTWASSNTNTATISPSGNPATLTKQAAYGTTVISATIIFNNCTTTVSKFINVGGTQLAGISIVNALGTTENWCSSHMQNGYTLEWSDNVPGTADVELRSFPGMTLLSTTYGASGTVYLTPPPPVPPAPGWYSVYATSYNACGQMSTAGIIVESKNCNFLRMAKDSGTLDIQVSPNPANDILTVSITNIVDGNTKPAKAEKIQISLYNLYNKQLSKEWNFDDNKNKYNLNVNNLQKGQYVLLITKGKNKQAKMVFIE